MPKLLTLNNGVPTEQSTVTTGGAPNAGKVPELDGNGRFPTNMMPNGIGPDTVTVTASEALAAGDFVNVYNNAGAFSVRKADASAAGKYANGYVLAAVANAAPAVVFTDDLNDQVTAQTAGDVFLSATTPGRTVSTPPSATGQVSQRLGFAASTTAIKVKIEQHYVLA